MDLHQLLTACSFAPEELRSYPPASGETVASRVEAVTDDSRAVTSAAIFVLTPVGAPYLRGALKARPAAVLTGRADLEETLRLCEEIGVACTVLAAGDLLMAQGRIAAMLHGDPSGGLEVTGVTGTNGKTSTVFMLYHIWCKTGVPAGLIGTLGVRWKGPGGREVEMETGYTTPRAGQLQEILGRMLADGVQKVAMEVSSEALALGRLEGMRFARAVFTNLTPEHLDYHGSMDEYFAAKMRLFDMTAGNGGEIIIYRAAPGGERAARYASTLADARVRYCDEPLLEPEELSVPAFFHRINASLALLACGLEEGESPRARTALQSLPPIPGRYTLVRGPGPGRERYGIVDYAHSPDGLENVLNACRAEGARYLICVFGCGGDRDRSKRPLMGAIAARLADVVIVTDDNPRTEDPAAIRAAIREGSEREIRFGAREPAAGNPEIIEIGDRRAAIAAGVDRVYASEVLPAVVLVAGKGHESVQIFADRRESFSDAAELEACFQERKGAEVVP